MSHVGTGMLGKLRRPRTSFSHGREELSRACGRFWRLLVCSATAVLELLGGQVSIQTSSMASG